MKIVSLGRPKNMSSKPLRVGVYIPSDLAEKIAILMKDMGLETLSKLVQEALRLYVAEHSWRIGDEVIGAIGILYDHEVGYVDEELTDLQHKYIEVVVTSTHVHLDQRNCLLVIIVKGLSDTIKRFLSDAEKVKGVKIVRVMLMPKQ